jgi:hypothetical protein
LKTAILQTSFWKDEDIYELNIDTKLLFMFLVTNPERNNTRFYKCPDRLITAYIGLAEAALQRCKNQLQEKKLIGFFDGWVIIGPQSYANPTKGRLSQKITEEDLAKVPAPVIDFADELFMDGTGTTPELVQEYVNVNVNVDVNEHVNVIPKQKKSDEWVDTWCLFMGVQPGQLSKREWKSLHDAKKEIVAMGATLDDLKLRCSEYVLRWPKVERTPNGILKNWSRLGQAKDAQKFVQTQNELAEIQKLVAVQ